MKVVSVYFWGTWGGGVGGGYSRQQLPCFNSSMAAQGQANIPNNPRMNVTACSLQVEVY